MVSAPDVNVFVLRAADDVSEVVAEDAKKENKM